MGLKDEIEHVIVLLVRAKQSSSVGDKDNHIGECIKDLERIKRRIPD